MVKRPVMLITGARKGIGRFLAEYYLKQEYEVVGCSRSGSDLRSDRYNHVCVDVTDEKAVIKLTKDIQKEYGQLDVLLNNAGIAVMNHALLTPGSSVRNIFETNVLGTFLFCREAAKVMRKGKQGRIVNFVSVATPLKLEGESIYAASKSAIISLTQILAREFAEFAITVNAIGPTPTKTDLIGAVPEKKIEELMQRQAIKRIGELRDISNVIDFFIRAESDFVTGQIVFLGGV